MFTWARAGRAGWACQSPGADPLACCAGGRDWTAADTPRSRGADALWVAHAHLFTHSSPQCSGSGSACFWAFRIRIHLSEVWIRIRWHFIFENDVNVPSTSSKQNIYFTSFLLVSWRSMAKIAGAWIRPAHQREGAVFTDYFFFDNAIE